MPYNPATNPLDPRPRLEGNPYRPENRGGPGNPGTANNMPQNDPFNQYGYSGQSPSLGRYVPPMLSDRNNLQSWGQQGGYAYNIPNSYGNPQYTQFNAYGQSAPNFGQSSNVPGLGNRQMPPMPQLNDQQRQLLTQFAGLPGMSEVTAPFRGQIMPQQSPNTTQPVFNTQAMGGMNKPPVNINGSTDVMQANYGMSSKPAMPNFAPPGGKNLGDGDGYGDGGGGGGGMMNWLRNEWQDRNGMPGQGEGGGAMQTLTNVAGALTNPMGWLAGQAFQRLPGLFGGGNQPVDAAQFPVPQFNINDQLPDPFARVPNSGTPGLGAGGAPATPGYEPYNPQFGGPAPAGSGLGPTPSGGVPGGARPRSTRYASGYRLRNSMEGMNALRDRQALDAMGLHNYGNRQR